MAHMLDLPEEIILIIFRLILKTCDQDEFLIAIPKVCRRWKTLCYSSQLWNKFDGSLPSKTLLRLSKKGYLQNAKVLVYSKSCLLKPSKKLETIFSGMPNLKTIDFHQVHQFTPEVFTCLQRNCQNVCDLKISHCSFHADEVFLDFLKIQKHKLSSIELSALSIRCHPNLLITITNVCYNLEKLKLGDPDLRGDPAFKFPLQIAQERCTKLKELIFISPVVFLIDEPHSNRLPGFPLLEVFKYPNLLDVFALDFTDKDLKNILSHSPLLKVLNITGHASISANAIVSLPATQLKSLFISLTQILDTKINATMVLTKWERSLSQLDISIAPLECINEVLQDIISDGKMCSLSFLDLGHTNVTKETVIGLIKHCKKLNILRQCFCYNLPTHSLQEFHTRDKILKWYNFL